MTARDYEIIEFVSYYKVASTDTIQQLFFPSLRICQRRLKILHEQKHLNRSRDSINNQYVYYLRRPAQLRHSLLVTDFYRELSKYCNVEVFKIEPTLGRIRPDAVIGYSVNGQNRLGLLEVEISHKGFDYAKYNSFDFSAYFPVRPRLFVVSDKTIAVDCKLPGMMVVPTSLSGVRLAVR